MGDVICLVAFRLQLVFGEVRCWFFVSLVVEFGVLIVFFGLLPLGCLLCFLDKLNG